MPNDDVLLTKRVAVYRKAIQERYEFWQAQLNPQGPLLTEPLDERTEFLLLREAARKARLAERGMMEPDQDAIRFANNEDNAQQRLGELAKKFSEEAG